MENHKQLMSFFKTVAVLAISLFELSCNNGGNANGTDTQVTDTSTAVQEQPTDTASVAKIAEGETCFAYLKNRDTILLQLTVKNSVATGKLMYNLYEKDKNAGTINGSFKNDTLLANYTYASEGMHSVRQVIFLAKGNVLVQGSGSMKEQKGKFVFTDKKDINFNSSLELEPVACDAFDKKK